MKRILNYLLNKQWILSIVMCFLSEGKKEQIYIARLRAEFIFFGHDISDMTDEEIKEGIKNIANKIGQFGATAEEAAKAFRVLSITVENKTE